jgi:hypothetical protein
MSKLLRAIIPALCIASLVGCGGDSGHSVPATVRIGGTITGLVGNLVLQNNAGDNLSVTTNGPFTFATPLNNGAAYSVTVLTQPPGPTCVVANGSGTATANVTSVSVTCTIDPATAFLPMSASVANSTVPGSNGLFVISSKSLADPPIQITKDTVSPLRLQLQYTVSSQGTLSPGNPSLFIYHTVNSSGGGHVWALNLSGASSLIPTQISSLTLPHYTEAITSHSGTTLQYVEVCRSQAIQKNLADPNSILLILVLPTDATDLCNSATKTVLIHASDSPTTDPVNLPSWVSRIVPLYRPDGTLAGLLTTDASENLNFYTDETFSDPRLLLTNAGFFEAAQEPPPGPLDGPSVNPTYAFLMNPGNGARGGEAVYRIDHSGNISPDLYDVSFKVSTLVDSGNLYFTANTFTTSGVLVGAAVGRIPGDGGSVQILQSMPLTGVNSAPSLIGISTSNLVLSGVTVTVSQTPPYEAQSQFYIAIVPSSAPGALTTIASHAAIPSISLASGDIFLNWADFDQGGYTRINSTEILDSNGNVLQGNRPSSSFISYAGPVLQVTNITAPSFLGGGAVNVLDLSQPASPTPVALKTTAGMAFNLPSGTGTVAFRPLTPTIGVADGSALQGQNIQPAYVYDLTKGIIVPISVSNAALTFLTY